MNLELRDHERDIVERPLGRRLSRRSHRRARVAVALVAGVVGIASCADILTPNTAPAAYVLTTIVGRPAAEVNLFQALKQADTLYGTYAYIVADTLVLDGHGRGEHSRKSR